MIGLFFISMLNSCLKKSTLFLDDLKLINIENNIDDDESEEEIPIF